MNCPNCNEQLSERGSFCKICAAQVRCMNCRELLEPAAKACVECGTKVGDSADPTNQPTGTTNSPASNRNTISFSEDRKNRRFEASLTDSAMHGLGGVFAELFAHRGIGRVTTHHPPNGKEEVVIDAMHQLPEPSGPPAAPAATTSADVPVTDKERILKLFSTNGDQLELIDNRLKAKSGRDYQRRLTYLTLYGHEVHGRTSLPRSDLTTILKSAKVMDSNARAWLAKKVGFTVDGDDRLKLIVGAREEAVTFLNEIADPNVADEWNPDTKTPRTKSKKNP